jgi:Ca2+:H+ antiporter
MLKLLRDELQIPAIWLTAALFLLFGDGWLASATTSTALSLFLFTWLFVTIMWAAFGVVRHAEHLADRLGEPYGTLILTMAVTIIEVAFIVTAVATSAGSTPVARDAVFAVVMIMLNGLVGLCLLLGGSRHHEQSYNLRGAQAFLSVVIPLASFALIMPNFTVATPGPILSSSQAVAVAVLTLALYCVFLAMQTRRYSSFFRAPDADGDALAEPLHKHAPAGVNPIAFHTAALALTLAPAVYVTKQLGQTVQHTVLAIGAPVGLVGVIVAVLVLAPESMGALQAALRNRLQRAVNIALGSVLATIGLTIPTVLVLGIMRDAPVILGLGQKEMLLLAITLVVSTLTFGGERTNMLQGAVHLVMFLVFLLLLFAP